MEGELKKPNSYRVRSVKPKWEKTSNHKEVAMKNLSSLIVEHKGREGWTIFTGFLRGRFLVFGGAFNQKTGPGSIQRTTRFFKRYRRIERHKDTPNNSDLINKIELNKQNLNICTITPKITQALYINLFFSIIMKKKTIQIN